MSKYRRDDKTFRAQIAALADSGLKFPTNFNGVPAYMRTHEPVKIVTNKFNLSGVIAGLVMGGLIGAIVGIVIGALLLTVGGAH